MLFFLLSYAVTYGTRMVVQKDTVISDCLFNNCYDTSYGGALYCYGSYAIALEHSAFINCSTSNSCGSCYTYELNNLTVKFNQFVNSSAPNSYGAFHFGSRDIVSTCNCVSLSNTNLDVTRFSPGSGTSEIIGMNLTSCKAKVYCILRLYSSSGTMNKPMKYITVEGAITGDGEILSYYFKPASLNYSNIISCEFGSTYNMIYVSRCELSISNLFCHNCSRVNYFYGGSSVNVYDSLFDSLKLVNSRIKENCNLSVSEAGRHTIVCDSSSRDFTQAKSGRISLIWLVLMLLV